MTRALSIATVSAAAATLYLLGSSKVFAGSTSLLDPYASVQAPQAKYKQKDKPHKQSGQAEASVKTKTARHKMAEPEAAEEPDSELASAPLKTPAPKTARPVKLKADKAALSSPAAKSSLSAKGPCGGEAGEQKDRQKDRQEVSKEIKPDSVTASGDGLMSGLKEIQHGYVKTFKAASSSFVNGTRAATAKLAENTKKMRDSVASGTGVLAHGLKATSDKVKAGAGSVGDRVKSGAETVGQKVKSVPDIVSKADKPSKKDRTKIAKKPEGSGVQQSPVEAPMPTGSADKLPDFSTLGKPLEPVEPLKNVKAPRIKNNRTGVISKAVDKINIFGKKPHAPPMPPIQPARNTAINPSAAQQLVPN